MGQPSLFLPLHTKGTRIIYDRKFLLECRSSPVARTPPHGLPIIPGVTSPPSRETSEKTPNGEALNNNNNITAPDGGNTGKFTPQTNITRDHRIWMKRSVFIDLKTTFCVQFMKY